MIRFPRRLQTVAGAIGTRRLQLVTMTAASLHAEAQDLWLLGEALSVRVPADWPPRLWEAPVRAHIVAQLTAQPETAGWHRYLLLTDEVKPLLVGCVGAFPCAAGDVELGYSVVDSEQRKGLATEAVEAHVAWLLRQPAVHSVSAQAYLSSEASVRVMQRCGMQFAGAGEEPETVRYRRWR